MTLSRRTVTSAVLVAAAGLLPAAVVAPAAQAATSTVTAFYEMNEPGGATVMHDSSGHGHNGTIDPRGVKTGVTVLGATGYSWADRSPTAPPASPERVIKVPDSIDLEPGDQDFTLEFRYRTSHKFGNIIQKGQATTKGGQWKVENPGGIPTCLFRGSVSRVATGSLTPLNDNTWHTITCTKTAQGVSMYVDGVFRSRKSGTVGTLNNSYPMTIGGKMNCDQIKVTCDYFSGQIDYVKITKGAGAPSAPPSGGPVAFVKAATAITGGSSVKVTLPASAPGQQVVMVLSRNNTTTALPNPSGVTGWTLLGHASVRKLFSAAWTKTVGQGDVGRSVTLKFASSAKMTLTVAAYANAGAPITFRSATDATNHRARVTPAVTATAGSWVVSYWADRSSSTTSWSTTAATARTSACDPGGGRVCSLLADSDGPVAGGRSAGKTASTNVASNKAVMWSIDLPATT